MKSLSKLESFLNLNSKAGQSVNLKIGGGGERMRIEKGVNSASAGLTPFCRCGGIDHKPSCSDRGQHNAP